ncbi:hypothetical protein HPB52_013007 [Rhipicephalus sanguineus]|uniref:Hexosyltransferase n=1 Tax=Rhipicephalus sanguineus TaxID=34632 RepID=A0A9D4PZR7_RHISA|nr:hypothetical protein HPB52_013007 [Rhipicephalus sanguineus]
MILFGRRSSRVVLHKKLVPIGICCGILLSLTAVPFMGCQRRKSPPSAKDGFLLWQSAPVDDEDFEPVLRLDGRSKTSQANSPEKVALKRPRFYSTELEIREKLLVVVLTSPETVEPFGAAVNRTLSRHPNKIIFYSCASDGESSATALGAPSVLQLPGTKCDSLASHVLKHLGGKNTAKDFDFVFLMRDSTYVNGEKLVSIATHVSVNVEVFLGRPANGACDLDAGLLLSNGVFKKVLGNIDSCLAEKGEILDDHIAQCIANVSGIPCSDIFQDQPFYSLNLDKDLGYIPDPATLTTRKDFSAVVTLYPVLTSKYFYPGVPDVFGNIRSFAVSSSNRFRRSNAKLATISIRIPEDRRVPSDFALIDLVVRKLPQDSLILLCQTGMEIRADYLNRVRMNTVSGVQVFLPVPFTQYHPVITEQDPVAPAFLELKRENGFFDSNNFKHFSFYVSDYWRHRALIAKEVPLAHSSTDLTADHYHDLTFGIVELFLVSKQLHLLRAVEPELRVRYIWRDCSDEPNLRAAENLDYADRAGKSNWAYDLYEASITSRLQLRDCKYMR